MSHAEGVGGADPANAAVAPRGARGARALLLPLGAAVVGVLVVLLLSATLSGYLVFLATTAVVAVIALMGLGVVTGSAGMISLCQLTFAAVGAWVVSWLNLHEAPGGLLVWLAVGALVSGAVGVLVGLPALRLRGVNLAVLTLGLAAAADVTLVQVQFPGASEGVGVLRPALLGDDRSYFVFCGLVLVAVALAVNAVQRSRWGSAWRSVAFSERGTAAAGASVTRAKLSAFAVSAALGGLSGGLVAAQVGLAFPSSFPPLQSLALYVLAVMCGVHMIDMALLAGVVWVAVPELLKQAGVPQDWALVVFGALGLQALASGGTLGGTLRAALARRRPAPVGGLASVPLGVAPPSAVVRTTDGGGAPHRTGATGGTAVGRSGPGTRGRAPLRVSGLTVQFGALRALDGVDLELPEGQVLGLIGPNGAGKSTLIDSLSGFLPQHAGDVLLDGRSTAGLAPAAHARLGLRRTFQQDRVPPELTTAAYVRLLAPGARRAEAAAALRWFGCPGLDTSLRGVDVGTRRVVEVVAHLLARPRVLLLDEPAAGLSHEEHLALGERLAQVPVTFDTSVLLVEHDLDLVRRTCTQLVVLDFGRVIATGPQEEVLRDPAVLSAYMGVAEA